MNKIYRPTKPGEITRCDDCKDKKQNCYECMIDDMLDKREGIITPRFVGVSGDTAGGCGAF